MKPKFATAWENRIKVVTHFDHEKEPSKTLQSDAAAADINNILKRYEKTGQLPDMIKTDPRYGDFSDVPTYQEAYATVLHANEQFNALSAQVRARFQNSPEEFLAFTSNPANIKEMVTMGLAIEKPKPVETPKPEVKP